MITSFVPEWAAEVVQVAIEDVREEGTQIAVRFAWAVDSGVAAGVDSRSADHTHFEEVGLASVDHRID